MKLFFHVACMDSLVKKSEVVDVPMWYSIVGQIMDTLEDSLLIDNCDIYRNHVGPLYKPGYDEYFNHDRVKNTQIGVLEDFEYSTLKELWLYSQKADPEEIIVYIHTKGVSHGSNLKSNNWRNYLLKMVIEKWEKHIKRFKESKELVALACPPGKGRNGNIMPYSRANWWWSKAKHLKSLPEPKSGVIYDYEKSQSRGKAWMALGSTDQERLVAWEQYDYFNRELDNIAYVAWRKQLNAFSRLDAEFWLMHAMEYNDLKTWDFFNKAFTDTRKLKRARALGLPLKS